MCIRDRVTDRDKHMERWQQMKLDGTPLEKIRAGQMMEAVGNEPLTPVSYTHLDVYKRQDI